MIKSPISKRIHGRFPINCKYCKCVFEVRNYRIKTALYCSRKCQALDTRIQLKANCLICNATFEHISSRCNKAKYCSRKCYYKAQTKKGKTQYKCTHCNKKFMGSLSHKRKYCSKACTGKESKKTWKAVFTTVRKNMISRGMIKKCNRCGFDSHVNILGVHHIDRNRHNNDLSNLEVLCPNCHSIEHSKHINHTGYFN